MAISQIKVGSSGTAQQIYAYALRNSSGLLAVGSGTKIVYFASGVPITSASTIGSTTWPLFLSSGTLTACSKIDEGNGQWTEWDS